MEQQQDWRERAVTRHLDPARTRAEERLQRLLAAAGELMDEGTDVTVQEVVRRAGLSLRTFYQHFAGKQELMLALLEAGSEELAEELSRQAALHADARDGLRAVVQVLQRVSRPHRAPRRAALAAFSAQVLHADPAALEQAQQRLVRVIEPLVAAAAPDDPHPLRTAAVLVNLVQGAARRDAVLRAADLEPLSTDEVWVMVSGLLSPVPPLSDAA